MGHEELAEKRRWLGSVSQETNFVFLWKIWCEFDERSWGVDCWNETIVGDDRFILNPQGSDKSSRLYLDRFEIKMIRCVFGSFSIVSLPWTLEGRLITDSKKYWLYCQNIRLLNLIMMTLMEYWTEKGSCLPNQSAGHFWKRKSR